MKDQIDFLTGRGIAAARLDSSLGLEETRAIADKLASGALKLLYVAPERFNNERFLAQISRVKLSMLAIDEAHCISEWGHNFRPDYLKIADFAKSLGAERVLALTATATPSVVADIRKAFDITDDDAVVTGFYRPNLRLATTPITADKRDALLLERLQKRPPGPTIVYVTLQKTAEAIAKMLSGAGLPAEAYHAGMESEDRSAIQERWMASDRGIVVATIAFGMGIDKANVRYVYHYNLPKSLESYSQEIGRAGRDDRPSTVEMLACPDDVPTLQNFAYGDTPTLESLKGLLDDLFGRGPEFDVSLYDLSGKYDLRQLVLKTVLTYLELMGVLRQGTPFYAGYEFRPNPDYNPAAIAEAFPGEPGKLIADLFRIAKKGRLWYALNPDDAAAQLDQERRRITRALEVIEERGMVELRVADSRLRYYRLRETEDSGALAAELMTRFSGREQAEMERLQRVLDLVTLDRCQVNALTGYFGETRGEPCGHCGFCLTARRAQLPPLAPLPPLPSALETEMRALRASHPDALGQPRQMARFLCGLSSPALTKAKLSRSGQFASLEERPFAEVLSWCESL
jgi:ATP-dependent DNA helicase RecQ